MKEAVIERPRSAKRSAPRRAAEPEPRRAAPQAAAPEPGLPAVGAWREEALALATPLIKHFEAGTRPRLEAYRCPAGVWTIGWGHTRTARPGLLITVGEAEALLREDLAESVASVERLERDMRGQRLAPHQAAALISFAFNLGPWRLAKGNSASVGGRIRRGDLAGAAEGLLLYNKARDPKSKKLVVMAGLTRRRVAERRLFLSATARLSREAHEAGREGMPQDVAEPFKPATESSTIGALSIGGAGEIMRQASGALSSVAELSPAAQQALVYAGTALIIGAGAYLVLHRLEKLRRGE